MGCLAGLARGVLRFLGTLAITVIGLSACFSSVSAQSHDKPGRVSPWPCRVVVKPTLSGVFEKGWRRSRTLQRQCRDLADAGAVVVLEWGRPDSQLRAVTTMKFAEDGVVVAHVLIPPARNALELVGHELEHVIERAQGLDHATESKRRGSGVWETHGIFETQRAIDAGRQVAKELNERPRENQQSGRAGGTPHNRPTTPGR